VHNALVEFCYQVIITQSAYLLPTGGNMEERIITTITDDSRPTITSMNH